MHTISLLFIRFYDIKRIKVLNVPHLRFPEFKDKWVRKSFDESIDYKKGRGLGRNGIAENGRECILYGDLYTIYKDNPIITNVLNFINYEGNFVLSKENDVIVPSSGESALEISSSACVKKAGVILGGDLNVLSPKDEIYGDFLAYQIRGARKNDIAKVSQGVSVIHLNYPQFSKIQFYFPGVYEQIKISKFFNLITQRIEIQRKLIDLYKSLIKSIYTYSIRTNNIKTLKLSELIQSKIIKVIKPSDLGHFEGYKTYLSTSSIIENKVVSNEGVVTFDKRPRRALLKPINNSVWFAKMKNSVKVFLADSYSEHNYIMSTGYYGFLSVDKILSRWLKFTFLSDYFNLQKDRFSEGSSMSAIKESQLNDISIPIIINETFQLEEEINKPHPNSIPHKKACSIY